ncbi:hypothetical protein VUR80DRAFT_6759 [Thermomyces stellatus]
MAEIEAEAEASLLPNPELSPAETRLPRTSAARLEQSPAEGPAPKADPDTVLYLAFGSNLCAETFQGKRGIRPLSAVNVTAPSLRLTFSIPGLPYVEPCFANTAPRKIPEKPLPDPRQPVLPPPVGDPEGEPTWDKGLVGVVYEVTKEDYRKIIATEGGGSSYKEIVVPCLVIPPKMSVPEKPGPEVPKPFLARTLCMPFIPSEPGDEDRSAFGVGDDGKKGWWWWLVRGPQREKEDYAQASERYLNLLRTGAAEHELPDEYQDYLAALPSYATTSLRQRVGKALMMLTWGPPLLAVMMLGQVLADEDGRMPGWLAVSVSLTFRAVWWSYDLLFKRLFGDGERTVDKDETLGIRRGKKGKIRLGV